MSDYEMPTPGPEHARLMSKVGRWSVRTRMEADPAMGPIEYDGKMHFRALGGFFLVGDYVTSMMGQELVGQSVSGFDPVRDCYVASWIDSMMPTLYAFAGDWDDDGVLRMSAVGAGPAGPDTEFASEERPISADRYEFKLSAVMPDGSKMVLMEQTYQRLLDPYTPEA